MFAYSLRIAVHKDSGAVACDSKFGRLAVQKHEACSDAAATVHKQASPDGKTCSKDLVLVGVRSKTSF